MKKLLFYSQLALWKVIYFFQDLPYLMTSRKRSLPDFLIVGAAKAGTTSLFDLLDQHPNIKMSRRKEPHFFSMNYQRGINYYKSFFPFKKENQLTGEASVSYLSDKHVPQRVVKTLPHVKIIILIREPVERAYSHYQMLRKSHEINQSFSDLLDEEVKFLSEGKRTIYGLIEKGLYGKALENWLQHIDRKNILIIESEAFAKSPVQTVSEVHHFMGISPIFPEDLSKKNTRTYEALSKELKDKYQTVFEADQIKLRDLSGKN